MMGVYALGNAVCGQDIVRIAATVDCVAGSRDTRIGQLDLLHILKLRLIAGSLDDNLNIIRTLHRGIQLVAAVLQTRTARCSTLSVTALRLGNACKFQRTKSLFHVRDYKIQFHSRLPHF